jgi:peptidoglycan/LPS O-acetylase OafA/YrhL
MLSTSPSVRYRQLDALRGLAALSVIFCHFRENFFPDQVIGQTHTAHVLLLLLLCPFTSGHEAVMFFFTLSGFVLALPYIHGRGQSYPTFLERRTLRIYGPYLGMLLPTLLCVQWLHGQAAHSVLRHGALAHQAWVDALEPSAVLQHLLFIGVFDVMVYNGVIWSLIVEMRLSIVFPQLFRLVMKLGCRVSILCATLLSAAAVICFDIVSPADPTAAGGLLTFHYTLMFVTGMVLAIKRDAIGAFYRGLSSGVRSLWLAGSLVLYWWTAPVVAHLFKPIYAHVFLFQDWVILVGVVGIMVAAVNAPWVQRVLETPVPEFLGRISYSLYLTHLPLLFVMGIKLGPYLPTPVMFVAFVIGALLLGYVFNRLVEVPFTSLSHKVGKRAKAATGLRVESSSSQPRPHAS